MCTCVCACASVSVCLCLFVCSLLPLVQLKYAAQICNSLSAVCIDSILQHNLHTVETHGPRLPTRPVGFIQTVTLGRFGWDILYSDSTALNCVLFFKGVVITLLTSLSFYAWKRSFNPANGHGALRKLQTGQLWKKELRSAFFWLGWALTDMLNYWNDQDAV